MDHEHGTIIIWTNHFSFDNFSVLYNRTKWTNWRKFNANEIFYWKKTFLHNFYNFKMVLKKISRSLITFKLNNLRCLHRAALSLLVNDNNETVSRSEKNVKKHENVNPFRTGSCYYVFRRWFTSHCFKKIKKKSLQHS